MSCVLDASVTLAWLLPGEITAAIQSVFDEIIARSAFVPSLWRIEVANGLSMGVRRKRISLEERNGFIEDLLGLPIIEDVDGLSRVWGLTLRLSDLHQLTLYDATYLELALRLSLPLATLDNNLRKAAQAEGVALLGL